MPQQPAVSETPAGAPTRTYTVSEGDTLSGIAVIFLGDEGGWVRIAEANPSVNPNRLRIGTRLTIPPHQPRQARSRNVASTAVSQRQHQVEQGESLSSISSHYYGRETMWVQIFEANRAQLKGDPNRLRVGMLLDLPR
jgi:nucleoid-associated protein YgaU